MTFVEMLQNGGFGAYAALAFGVLGSVVGVVAMLLSLVRNRAGFGAGIATLIIAGLSSMAGIIGTFVGRAQMQVALGFVESAVTRERISLAGWGEASNSALVGFFGALVPFMLGAAAALIGARITAQSSRVQGEAQVVSTDANASRVVMAMIFSLITLISAGGAWVVAHQSPPQGRYNFHRDDDTAWHLADDIECANEDLATGCRRLEETLRDASVIPESLRADVKSTSRKCVEQRLANDDDVAALLTSPLLQDDDLREKVKTHGAIPSLPPPGDEGLDRNTIATVVRTARETIQRCYERALVKQPKLAGKVEIQFTISGRGDVSEANASEKSTLDDAQVVSCVREAIERLKFPAPGDGEPVTVSYPFDLKPAK